LVSDILHVFQIKWSWKCQQNYFISVNMFTAKYNLSPLCIRTS
jgi:hypothetical protein